jgi:hypothetical protein
MKPMTYPPPFKDWPPEEQAREYRHQRNICVCLLLLLFLLIVASGAYSYRSVTHERPPQIELCPPNGPDVTVTASLEYQGDYDLWLLWIDAYRDDELVYSNGQWLANRPYSNGFNLANER